MQGQCARCNSAIACSKYRPTLCVRCANEARLADGEIQVGQLWAMYTVEPVPKTWGVNDRSSSSGTCDAPTSAGAD